MRRILVLRGGALGDFLVTLPALALLRQRWPDARIELVGNPTAAAVALNAGLLDSVESQHDRAWGALYDPKPLPSGLQARLTAMDLIISYWPDPDATLGRRFPLHSAQCFLSAAALPAVAPAAAHYCAPLQTLGLHQGNYAYSLTRPRSISSWIALHPGSGSSAKNWPIARWANVADWLRREYAARLFIISGEAEPEGILRDQGEAWRNLPLVQLLGRLAQCRLFLGHDSGVSHLAAATGISSLLLFGPTDPALWAPPHAGTKVIRSGMALDDITEESVQQAIAAILLDQS